MCASRNLSINLDEGGMPWTCLPGEPSNVNWCNGAGGADLYKNPPAAWRGAKQHGAVPVPLALCSQNILLMASKVLQLCSCS